MSAGPAAPGRAAWRSLAALPLVAAFLVWWAGPAGAHASLESSDPPPGARLDTAPAVVTLRFSEAVDVALGGTRLLDESGAELDVGEPRHGADHSEVVVPLPALGDGGYLLSWRVLSVDSHPIGGALAFVVGTGNAPGADVVARAADDIGADPWVERALTVVRALQYAALAVLVGAGGVALGLWPGGLLLPRARRMLWAALAVAVATAAAGLGLQGAWAIGGALGDAVAPSTVREVLGTRFGRAWGARLGLLVLVSAPLLVATRANAARRAGALYAAWVTMGGALVATVVLTGHSTTGRASGLGLAADALHVGAMTAWLGGLALVAHALSSAGAGDDEAGRLAPRFSALAGACVAILAATGAVQSWRQLDSLDSLASTTYGRLLVAKLVAVAAVLALARVSRRQVRPRAAPAGGPGAAVAAGRSGRAALRRAVLGELGTGALVLALTAALVGTPPPQRATATLEATRVDGDLLVSVLVTPNVVGPNELHVTLARTSGTLLGSVEAQARLRRPAGDVGTIQVPLVRAGVGHFLTDAMQVPLAGAWTLDVIVRLSASEVVSLSFPFETG